MSDSISNPKSSNLNFSGQSGKSGQSGLSKNSGDDDRWLILKHAALEKQLETVFLSFREHQIEPIVVKGWAAGRLYPEKWRRYFSDIDLAIAPADYERAKSLLKLHPQILIDLHQGLRHLDTVDWPVLFENSRLIGLGKTQVRVLSEEDHLRVLAVHWLQDGGAYRHRLWDIYYAVAARHADFDWEKCLGAVSEKRRRWIICTIGLAHNYLDLEIEDLPFTNEALQIPRWMIKTIEDEWQTETRLVPLENSLDSGWGLLKQIYKRFPPNAVQSTIEMEGNFNNFPRIFYQIGSIAHRLMPSIKRLITKKKAD